MRQLKISWQLLLLAIVIPTFFVSCKDEDEVIDGGEGGAPIQDEPDDSFVADNAIVQTPTFICVDDNSGILNAILTRYTSSADVIDKNTKNVITSTEALSSHTAEIAEAYRNGAVITVLDPDMKAVGEWCNENEINCSFSNDGSRNLLLAFCGPKSYSIDYPTGETDFNKFLNNYVAWVNDAQQPKLANYMKSNAVGGDFEDVTKLFDAQTITHEYLTHIDAEVGHIIFADPDTFKADGSITLMMTIYPLHAFDDQSGHGDYYIIDATVTAHNRQMWHGVYTNKHGGMRTHIMGAICRNIGVQFNLKDVSDAQFANGQTPSPATTALSTQHTEGIAINIGGSLTGGISDKGPNAGLSVNGGVSFNNTTTRTIPDLTIENNWSNSTVCHDFIINDDSYMQGFGGMYPPTAVIATNNCEVRMTWVWRVPSVSDNSNQKLTATARVTAKHRIGRMYTSVAESKFYYFDNTVQNSDFTFTLTPPNRRPTGTLQLKNDDNDGTYVTNIRLWRESSTSSQPDYIFTDEVGESEILKKNIVVGHYRVEIDKAKNGVKTTYKKTDNITISRANNLLIHSHYGFVTK